MTLSIEPEHHDSRLETFLAIMTESASNGDDELPDAYYEALEESAARAAGFRNIREAREALFARVKPRINIVAKC